jgi:uncharacterized CHY-type Zn-finger protein
MEQVGIRKASDQAHFVICGACYWCASVLHQNQVQACPTCQNRNIDAMPISSDEKYVIDYDEERGMTLDFVPRRNK